MIIKNISVDNFQQLDNFILETRTEFRENKSLIRKLFFSCIDLFIHLVTSMGNLKPSNKWENTREEDFLRVLGKIIEILTAIYYLYESGFYSSAFPLYRNICELSIIAIAIGYDPSLHHLWCNKHKTFKKTSKIIDKITESKKIPEGYKDYARFLQKEWERSSREYSHSLRREHVERKIVKERIFWGVTKYNYETQDNKVWSLVVLAFNMITLTSDVFNYESLVNENKIKHGQKILGDFQIIDKNISELEKEQNQTGNNCCPAPTKGIKDKITFVTAS